jgi:riboflavin-specific deaminase-like protein
MAAEGDIRGHAEAQWQAFLARRRDASPHVGSDEIGALYGPLCTRPAGQTFVIAHLAQSLDGRIAAANGASRWISGDEDLRHTHRMRALADAVIVGADTILHDNPLLTVRRCAGNHPVRVIIDPRRKLHGDHNVFSDRSAPTLIITTEAGGHAPGIDGAEIITLPRDGMISPAAIIAALKARGLHWLFIEGGGVTISHFLRAGCLDRLQLTVAPVIMGSGRPSLTLPEIADPASGLRPTIRRVSLGEDTLFECVFGT